MTVTAPTRYEQVTGFVTLGLGGRPSSSSSTSSSSVPGKTPMAVFSKLNNEIEKGSNTNSEATQVVMSSDYNLYPFLQVFANELKNTTEPSAASFIISSPTDQECLRFASIIYSFLVRTGHGQAQYIRVAHLVRKNSQIQYNENEMEARKNFGSLKWMTLGTMVRGIEGHVVVRVLPSPTEQQRMAKDLILADYSRDVQGQVWHGYAKNEMDKTIQTVVAVVNRRCVHSLIHEMKEVEGHGISNENIFTTLLTATFPIQQKIKSSSDAKRIAKRILTQWDSRENDSSNAGIARQRSIEAAVENIQQVVQA